MAREASTPKRLSVFWSEADKSTGKNESFIESCESKDNADDDNDEMVPYWFRQLDQHEIKSATEEFDTNNTQEVTQQSGDIFT